MCASNPVIHPLSERALLIIFAETASRSTTETMLAFEHEVLQIGGESIMETVLALRSVLVVFDPVAHEAVAIEDLCRRALKSLKTAAVPARKTMKTYRLPAVYGDTDGPDLNEAADLAGLTSDDFIEQHATCFHDVSSIGFAPGLAYLTGLPEAFAIPRNPTASKPVPAGSLLVANRQTVLPATPIPTGWKRIARTPVIGFRLSAERPCLLAPGDRVTFTPVSAAEAAAWHPDTPWRTLEIDGT